MKDDLRSATLDRYFEKKKKPDEKRCAKCGQNLEFRIYHSKLEYNLVGSRMINLKRFYYCYPSCSEEDISVAEDRTLKEWKNAAMQ